jgi:diguanylate cyclase (GGDEF)-like protein
VLRQVARTLHAQLRPDALLTRYGGEEFAAVVPVADLASARQVAERLRFAVAECPCQSTGGALTVTISVGMTMLGHAELLDAGILRADQALYRAKQTGRDRVEASLVATTDGAWTPTPSTRRTRPTTPA